VTAAVLPELTLMICPPPFARMCGSTAWMPFTTLTTLRLDLLDPDVIARAGVADQCVHSAVPVNRGADQCVDLRGIGDVGRHGQSAAQVLAQYFEPVSAARGQYRQRAALRE
jgi:hypothetical protein